MSHVLMSLNAFVVIPLLSCYISTARVISLAYTNILQYQAPKWYYCENMSLYGSQQACRKKCIHFEKCCCNDLNCGFVHMYKYCFQYQNTTYSKKKCLYLHCTSMEQYRYIVTGKATENLKREVGRTLQNTVNNSISKCLLQSSPQIIEVEENLTISFVNLAKFSRLQVPLFLNSFVFYCAVFDLLSLIFPATV